MRPIDDEFEGSMHSDMRPIDDEFDEFEESVHSNMRPINCELKHPTNIEENIRDIRNDVLQLSNVINRSTRETRVRGALFQNWKNLLDKAMRLYTLISANAPITIRTRQAFAAIKMDLQRIYDEDSTTYAEILPPHGSFYSNINWSPAERILDLPNFSWFSETRIRNFSSSSSMHWRNFVNRI